MVTKQDVHHLVKVIKRAEKTCDDMRSQLDKEVTALKIWYELLDEYREKLYGES